MGSELVKFANTCVVKKIAIGSRDSVKKFNCNCTYFRMYSTILQYHRNVANIIMYCMIC